MKTKSPTVQDYPRAVPEQFVGQNACYSTEQFNERKTP